MHHFLPIFPIKRIDKLKNPMRYVQLLIQQLINIVGIAEMVNIDVEVDSVAAIVSDGKGIEATRKGGEAV